jgi:hypothetical protein
MPHDWYSSRTARHRDLYQLGAKSNGRVTVVFFAPCNCGKRLRPGGSATALQEAGALNNSKVPASTASSMETPRDSNPFASRHKTLTL